MTDIILFNFPHSLQHWSRDRYILMLLGLAPSGHNLLSEEIISFRWFSWYSFLWSSMLLVFFYTIHIRWFCQEMFIFSLNTITIIIFAIFMMFFDDFLSWKSESLVFFNVGMLTRRNLTIHLELFVSFTFSH